MPVSPLATALIRSRRADLLVVGEQAVGVGDEDALAAVAVAGRHLDDRGAGRRGRPRRPAAAARPWSALATVVGVRARRCSTGGAPACGSRATVRAPPPPWLAAAAAASAAAAQAGLGEVGGVGEAGGLARDDPDAGAAVAAAGHLLDPAVVEPGRRRPLVLGVHLGELGAGAYSTGEHPFQDVAGRSRETMPTGDRRRPLAVDDRVNLANGPAWRRQDDGRPTPTRHGRSDRARSTCSARPRLIALCEEAAVAAVADALDAGCTTVGMRVQLDHLQPTRGRCRGRRRGRARTDRGPAPDVHRVGVRRRRPGRRRQGHPRPRRRRALHGQVLPLTRH